MKCNYDCNQGDECDCDDWKPLEGEEFYRIALFSLLVGIGWVCAILYAIGIFVFGG